MRHERRKERDFPCTKCGALAGKPCITCVDTVKSGYHAARFHAMRDHERVEFERIYGAALGEGRESVEQQGETTK
jgi:hypothetical protein